MAPTIKRNTSSTSAAGRSTTAAASRRARASSGPVRVWSECAVTVRVDDYQFVKFTHGFEMMSPNDSRASLKATEAHIYEACEEVVNLRVRKLRRLIRRLSA